MEDKEHLGYLTALIEDLKEDIKTDKAERKEWRDKTDDTLTKLQKELDMYATIIKTVKFIGAGALALLTFKWSGLSDIWQHFWK